MSASFTPAAPDAPVPPRDHDTIAAIATPSGRGGVGIVRVSGPAAAGIAGHMLGRCPPPRRAEYLPFHDAGGTVIDEGIALYFAAPNSFTGEDVLELQGHGGPVVMDLLLAAVLQLGARQARPGEFSQRAFLNDKLDLAQAEAIADLIDSSSVQAARCALRSLQGEFSRRVEALTEELIQLRLYVESAIDFPEEEIDFLADGVVAARLAALRGQLHGVQDAARQGSLLREGMNVVLAGQPNAGKSSLLNALSGQDSAIVTDIPGTTRDVLRERIDIEGIPVHLADTAGIRDTEDAIEAEGVRRALRAVAEADLVLVVEDATGEAQAAQALAARLPEGPPRLRVVNKVDLLSAAERRSYADQPGCLLISARSGEGLDALRRSVRDLVGAGPGDRATVGGEFSARQRHVDALRRAAAHIDAGAAIMASTRAGELLAEELRLAQQQLGEITGEMASDDLLGQIFSSFCIGK